MYLQNDYVIITWLMIHKISKRGIDENVAFRNFPFILYNIYVTSWGFFPLIRVRQTVQATPRSPNSCCHNVKLRCCCLLCDDGVTDSLFYKLGDAERIRKLRSITLPGWSFLPRVLPLDAHRFRRLSDCCKYWISSKSRSVHISPNI